MNLKEQRGGTWESLEGERERGKHIITKGKDVISKIKNYKGQHLFKVGSLNEPFSHHTTTQLCHSEKSPKHRKYIKLT